MFHEPPILLFRLKAGSIIEGGQFITLYLIAMYWLCKIDALSNKDAIL